MKTKLLALILLFSFFGAYAQKEPLVNSRLVCIEEPVLFSGNPETEFQTAQISESTLDESKISSWALIWIFVYVMFGSFLLYKREKGVLFNYLFGGSALVGLAVSISFESLVHTIGSILFCIALVIFLLAHFFSYLLGFAFAKGDTGEKTQKEKDIVFPFFYYALMIAAAMFLTNRYSDSIFFVVITLAILLGSMLRRLNLYEVSMQKLKERIELRKRNMDLRSVNRNEHH